MITSKVMKVTPDQARAWLEGNTHNRPIRQKTVERYARDMAEGHWRLTHQGIAFNGDGTLVDGQHRLWAISESESTIELMVTTGLTMSAQAFIDGGETRGLRDVMVLKGESGVTQLHVGIAKLLTMQITSVANPTRSETMATYTQHREAIWFAAKCFTKRIAGIYNVRVATPIVRAWYSYPHAALVRFAQVLTDGVVADPTEHVIVHLRNHLLTSNPKRHEVYAKVERALLAFLKGEPAQKLYAASGELFPLPGAAPVKKKGRKRA